MATTHAHPRYTASNMSFVVVSVLCIFGAIAAYNPEDEARVGRLPPLPGTLSSVGGGAEESPPVYRPGSQAYVVSHFAEPKTPHVYWQEETSLTLAPENKNCMLCEAQDSGACCAMPSCVYCEATVTALCERSTPCLRCTVIKNPFFKCIPGEKYMDECDSCRCTDGHSGWCTNQFCEFRALHIYAIKLSDGEFY
ncbi:uncharacterized protein LOC113227260 [Hyposmocoma kahamanoa]|uniref:uncharacterized protein LOC113227260 n=1 Tax=Hyposmocoma kahamanoa TaxID=1477025 RepID=UPI000E6D6850|nr:uncharacterized protein LOC113227260 [Hyposmocoma kahamanoa]